MSYYRIEFAGTYSIGIEPIKDISYSLNIEGYKFAFNESKLYMYIDSDILIKHIYDERFKKIKPMLIKEIRKKKLCDLNLLL